MNLDTRYLVYAPPPTVLELYRCLGHGLNMCLLFGHNSHIIFCYFFHKMNLVIFADTRYLVYLVVS